MQKMQYTATVQERLIPGENLTYFLPVSNPDKIALYAKDAAWKAFQARKRTFDIPSIAGYGATSLYHLSCEHDHGDNRLTDDMMQFERIYIKAFIALYQSVHCYQRKTEQRRRNNAEWNATHLDANNEYVA